MLLRKAYLLPVFLVVLGLMNFALALWDYLSSADDVNGVVVTCAPLLVISIFAIWVALRARKSFSFLADKVDLVFNLLIGVIYVTLFAMLIKAPYPSRDAFKYVSVCFYSGYVVCLGFLRYLDGRKNLI